MAKASDIPTYNMKVVVHETGLKPDTLRAWERRYGLPNPERTTGGHRLYSQREIDMLKWLIARQEEGLSISNAVDLWHTLTEAGRDPLVEYGEPEAPELTPIVQGGIIEESRHAWVEACLAFDETNAQHVLAQTFALFPIESVCFDVLQKGLQEIGQGWYEGRISVQQEHFASALAIRQLEALLAAMTATGRHGRLLVACPPHEQHTFSPLLLSVLFRRRGWDVVYLGANVPADRLEAAVQTIQPQLVILAAQTLLTAATMLELAQLLRDLGVPLAYGGAVFTQMELARERMPGHFLGKELREAPQAVEALLDSLPPVPPVPPVSAEYREALGHFRERRAQVEAYVHENGHTDLLTTVYLSNANEDLGDNIEAALALGDMDLLWANIAWVRGLLMSYHYRMPAEEMDRYLAVYCAGAERHLDRRGQPVLEWLSRLREA